jgi:hypothetical protein
MKYVAVIMGTTEIFAALFRRPLLFMNFGVFICDGTGVGFWWHTLRPVWSLYMQGPNRTG